MKVKIKDLKPGDLVDLEGDRYADPNRDRVEFEFELQTVAEIEQETADCTCVYFDNCAFGFPPEHTVEATRPRNV